MLFAIPTAGHPSLHHALRAIQRITNNTEETSVVIADESRSADAARVICEAVAFARESGINRIVHLSHDHRTEFLSAIVKASSVNPEIIAFGLRGCAHLGPTYGAAQNLLHLITKGSTAWFCDDDIRLRLSRRRDVAAADAVWFSDVGDPEEIVCYPSEVELDLAIEPFDGDFSDIEAVFSRTQQVHRKLKITILGLHGDPAWSSASFMLFANNHITREYASRSNYDYVVSKTSRHVVKGVRRPTLRAMCNFQSAVYRLDNNLPGVPFFPIFRGSDTLYGHCLGYAYPDYDIAYLPFLVAHKPSGVRRSQTLDISFTMAMFLRSCLDRFGTNGSKDVEGLSQIFSTLKCLNFNDLSQVVLEQAMWHRSTLLTLLTNRLDANERLTSAQFEDIVRFINRLHCQDRAASLITDMDTNSQSAFPSLIASWADLVEAWPEIETAARKINYLESRLQ